MMQRKQILIRYIIVLMSFAAVILCPFRAYASEDGEIMEETVEETMEETTEEGDTEEYIPSYQVTLYETYIDEYETYEESMNDIFFFYSNTENGAFTSESVTFDLPENLTYTLEKNGVEISYSASEEITEPGNYVLRLTGFYESANYNASFRFSIREKTAEKETVEDDAEMEENELEYDEIYDDPAFSLEDTEYDELENMDASLEIMDDNGVINEDALQQSIENQGSELYDHTGITQASSTSVTTTTGMTQAYDLTSGYYILNMFHGTNIWSNIPNGAIVNTSVSLIMPDTVTATVSKDGQLYEYSGMNFTEEGFYKISFYESSLAFSLVYPEEKDYPFLTFRIVQSPVNDITIFNAPQNTHIQYVIRNEEYLYLADMENPANAPLLNYYWMTEDGTYTFHVLDDSEAYGYDVKLTLDKQKPSFGIQIKNGVAAVQYAADDIAYVELTLNGNQVSNFSPYEIKGKGDYILNVYDNAGNCASASFHLGNSFQSANVTAIVLVILIVLGILFVIRRSKTHFKVR